MYLIIDENSIVSCVSEDIVHVLRQKNNVWKPAEVNTATAVFANGKHFSLDEYYVIEKQIVPEDIDIYSYLYDFSSDKFLYAQTLEEMKKDKQARNKEAFAEFLADKTVTWTDGKEYGVSYDDQAEIALNIAQYRAKVDSGVPEPSLEWHAIREESRMWNIEELSELLIAISEFVSPYFHKMQEYKAAIFAAENPQSLADIHLIYTEAI